MSTNISCTFSPNDELNWWTMSLREESLQNCFWGICWYTIWQYKSELDLKPRIGLLDSISDVKFVNISILLKHFSKCRDVWGKVKRAIYIEVTTMNASVGVLQIGYRRSSIDRVTRVMGNVHENGGSGATRLVLRYQNLNYQCPTNLKNFRILKITWINVILFRVSVQIILLRSLLWLYPSFPQVCWYHQTYKTLHWHIVMDHRPCHDDKYLWGICRINS